MEYLVSHQTFKVLYFCRLNSYCCKCVVVNRETVDKLIYVLSSLQNKRNIIEILANITVYNIYFYYIRTINFTFKNIKKKHFFEGVTMVQAIGV